MLGLFQKTENLSGVTSRNNTFICILFMFNNNDGQKELTMYIKNKN